MTVNWLSTCLCRYDLWNMNNTVDRRSGGMSFVDKITDALPILATLPSTTVATAKQHHASRHSMQWGQQAMTQLLWCMLIHSVLTGCVWTCSNPPCSSQVVQMPHLSLGWMARCPCMCVVAPSCPCRRLLWSPRTFVPVTCRCWWHCHRCVTTCAADP